MKVIVAGEDELYTTMLANTLRNIEHEPIILNSGPEVINSYEKNDDVDLLFLDWELSGIDGLEVSSKLRDLNFRSNRDCYIIITGDKGGRYDIMKAMEMGANDIITKPFDSSTIEERLSTAMDYFLKLPQEVDKSNEDPIENLINEHGILRFQSDKLYELLDSVDEEAPNKLINWLSGRMFILETNVHQDKENELSVLFMERLMHSHGEENKALSESSSKWVESEHMKLEKLVSEIKERFVSYEKTVQKPPQPIEQYNIMEHVKDFPAYCLKCKKKVVMVEPTIFQMDTGNYAFKGKCPDCESGVTAIIGKSIGAMMKHVALKRTLKKYLELLKEHLKREEDLYFPLANKYLTSGDRNKLIEDFKEIEKKYGIDRMGKDFKMRD